MTVLIQRGGARLPLHVGRASESRKLTRCKNQRRPPPSFSEICSSFTISYKYFLKSVIICIQIFPSAVKLFRSALFFIYSPVISCMLFLLELSEKKFLFSLILLKQTYTYLFSCYNVWTCPRFCSMLGMSDYIHRVLFFILVVFPFMLIF